MHVQSLTSTLYDMNAAKAHTSATHFNQYTLLHFFVTTSNQAQKKNPKLQLVEDKLKFFVKQLQSENEALFEQIYSSIYFLFHTGNSQPPL